jgi:hypothetical protein
VANKVKATFGPNSLEELSHHASWKDVIDMATEVLVVKKAKVAQLLSRS